MSGICRKDKFARKSYEAIHNTKGEWTAHDITTVTDDDLRLLRGQVDVICGGFPAKPSVLPESDWDSQKLEELCSSKLLDSPKKSNHNIYSLKTSKAYSITTEGTHLEQSSTLDELGYDAEWQVLNSKDFGVPQNRERVFIVGHLRGSGGREVFPIRRKTLPLLKSLGI